MTSMSELGALGARLSTDLGERAGATARVRAGDRKTAKT